MLSVADTTGKIVWMRLKLPHFGVNMVSRARLVQNTGNLLFKTLTACAHSTVVECKIPVIMEIETRNYDTINHFAVK